MYKSFANDMSRFCINPVSVVSSFAVAIKWQIALMLKLKM